MTFKEFHHRFPTAWENMVCQCGLCEGCKLVLRRKKALWDSFKATNKEIEKRVAEIYNEAFSHT